jgi:PAS domain S-box-containing protein
VASAVEKDSITSWGATKSQLEAIIEGMAEGLIVLDIAEARVLYLNKAARRMLGLRGREGQQPVAWYAERFPLNYLDGRAVEGDERPLARALKGETFGGLELQVMRRGEVESWSGRFSGTVVKDAILMGVVTLEDITREAEAEARFQIAFRLSPVATAITRISDLKFVDVNESFLKLTGFEYREVIGHSALELNLHLETEKRNLALKQGAEGTVGPVEMEMRRKDGRVLNVRSIGEVIRLYGEAHLLDVFDDVTERRKTEEQLLRAIEEVMRDTTWFSRSVVEKLANLRGNALPREAQREIKELTERERQVLGRVARGESDQDIADELGLSRQTIRNYVTNIYSKIGVHTRAEAVVWARERGVIG